MDIAVRSSDLGVLVSIIGMVLLKGMKEYPPDMRGRTMGVSVKL